MTTHFRDRLVWGTLGTFIVGITLSLAWHPFVRPLFIALCSGTAVLSLIEYYHLSEKKGFRPLILQAVGGSVCYLIALALALHHVIAREVPYAILLLSFLWCFIAHFRQIGDALGNLAVTVFGTLYLTLPLGCLLQITYSSSLGMQDGRLWVGYVLAVSKMTDVGAYFFGHALGGAKLAVQISPHKTISGAIGGIVAALATSMAFWAICSGSTFSLSGWQSLWLGGILSLLAQIGDLSESLLKRDAAVKDSSQLPGLGGILDLVDSLVFSSPLIFLFLEAQWGKEMG